METQEKLKHDIDTLRESIKLDWQDKISGCFGCEDCIFAGYHNDEKCAKDTIKAAKSAGATFEEFEKEVVWHCYKKVTASGMLQDHIQKQVAKLKKLWGMGSKPK
jgi:hypothetical protein